MSQVVTMITKHYGCFNCMAFLQSYQLTRGIWYHRQCYRPEKFPKLSVDIVMVIGGENFANCWRYSCIEFFSDKSYFLPNSRTSALCFTFSSGTNPAKFVRYTFLKHILRCYDFDKFRIVFEQMIQFLLPNCVKVYDTCILYNIHFTATSYILIIIAVTYLFICTNLVSF